MLEKTKRVTIETYGDKPDGEYGLLSVLTMNTNLEKIVKHIKNLDILDIDYCFEIKNY